MKFTCKLRELLAARNMCQYQLAAAACMSTTNMSKIAAGDRLPHQDTVERITAALGCAPADIWPEYARHLSERTERQRINLDLGRTKRAYRESKAASELKIYRAERRARASEADVVPLADGAAAQEFTLRAGFAGPHELESPVWCQRKAFALHNYLVRNCAWGVYKHLRQMMADENRLAEERRRAIAE